MVATQGRLIKRAASPASDTRKLQARIRQATGLARVHEHWIGGWQTLDETHPDERVALVWMERETRMIRTCSVTQTDDPPRALLLELFNAMDQPLPGCGRARPAHIHIPDDALPGPWKKWLAPLDIRIGIVDADALEDAFLDIAAALAYGQLSYLHQAETLPDHAERFFDVAAELWNGSIFDRTSAHDLFSVCGLTPLPAIVSMTRESEDAFVRIYLSHIDHVIGNILQQQDGKGLHVLLVTYVRRGEVSAALFEQADTHGWRLPTDAHVPMLSVTDHEDSVRPPRAHDFELAASVLEALLHWDGRTKNRHSHILKCGRKVTVSWPLHVTGLPVHTA